MSSAPPHTALMVFIRDEREEAGIKRFAAGRRASRRAARLLNCRVLSLAKSTGIPTFVISGEQQLGDTFGQRYSRAFRDLFALGYQRIISIGNDCPALTRHRLLEAAAGFCSHGLVLGPAYDGGAYIIGIDRKFFDPLAFEALPWQKPELLQALLDYGRSLHGKIVLLDPEWDADDARSLRQAINGLSWKSSLRRCLLALLQPVSAPARTSAAAPLATGLLTGPALRGPPASCAA